MKKLKRYYINYIKKNSDMERNVNKNGGKKTFELKTVAIML